MQSLTAPISQLIRTKNADDDGEPKKKTREEWKKDKELEEARKLGTVPAAVDEDGKDINPHIPQYISQVPWYFGNLHPTLKHQRVQPENTVTYSKLDEWYKRGADTVSGVSSKFRKGACDNCGAMTHKRKDCLERPRKIGARFTGADVAPDEKSQPSLTLGFDGKRDRWNGYDPAEYSQVIEEHRKVEEAKRQMKASRLNTASTSAETVRVDDGGGAGSDSDDEKYAEGFDMPGTKVDSKQRITVRNLRIREDTAKYLRNLALDSAYYDPKTRSMRENPYEGKGMKDVDYKGENFERYTGDTSKHARTQIFSWEAQKNGVDVHLISDPTRLELLQKEYESNRDDLEGSAKNSLINRYGGQEHLEAPPRELLLAQTENYVEYSRQGKVIKGAELAIARSQYEEDVYINNHTSVWGSYWHDGVWGYKCCHSTVKNSYCTGEAGREACSSDPIVAALTDHLNANSEDTDKAAVDEQPAADSDEAREARKQERRRKKAEKKQKKKAKKRRQDEKPMSSDGGSGSEDEEEVRKRKIAQAMMEQLAEEAHAKRLMAMDERKRPYNSMSNISEPTAEEMEAWRMRQARQDDPMANFTTDC